MRNPLSVFWAALQQFYELPKPIQVHKESFIACCIPLPSLLTVPCQTTFSQVLAPFQPLAPHPWQPRDLVASFTPQCGPRCPSPPGALDVSRQATSECLSGENPKWPPGQGKEWEA